MNSFVNESIKNKTHSALTISNFWPQFLEAIAEELSLVKAEYDLTRDYKNINVLLESDIINICKKFGYNPNLVLDNSLEFIRQEAKLIPYRIRNKSTYTGFNILFKAISESGEVYNTFYDGTKLVKAVNNEETIAFFDTITDFTQELYPFIADKNFSTILTGGTLLLDDGHTLDNEPFPFKLDFSASIIPSNHLIVAHKPKYLYYNEDNATSYLMTKEYFEYLEVGNEYLRKATAVTHSAVSISAAYVVTTEITERITEEGEVRVTEDGDTRVIEQAVPFLVNTVELQTKDTLHSGYVSSCEGTSLTTDVSKFKYFSIGNGKYNISSDIYTLFNRANLTLYYTFDEIAPETEIRDYSLYHYDGTVYGNILKRQGILGRVCTFDSNTYVSCDTLIPITYVEMTISFWFKKEDNLGADIQYVFDMDLIKCKYDNTQQKLIFTFNSVDYESEIDLNTNYTIFIEFDKTQANLNIYLNTTLEHTIDITLFDYSGNYPLFIGSDKDLAFDKLYGIVDDFIINKKIYFPDEKANLITNKLGLISHLFSPICRDELSKDFEIVQTDDYILVNSYCSGNTINDEFLFTYDTMIDTYLGQTLVNSILPYSLKIKYKQLINFVLVDVVVTDDGKGNINNDYISGTINYETGEYLIHTYRDIDVPYQLLSSTPISTLNFALNENVSTGSCKLYFTIGVQDYVVTDDGLGNFISTGLTAGTIDYNTGIIDLTFDGTTVGLTHCEYSYTRIPDINDGEGFSIEYQFNGNLEITEMAIEDENKDVILYCTFPPVQFNSSIDSIVGDFVVIKEVALV